MKQPHDNPLWDIYNKVPYLSIKHSSYFQVYEQVFDSYRGKPIVFVEVGILNGGSLFMWRDFLGEQARIIGVDLNPEAKKWEEHGFEIYIGDQANPDFWSDFFSKVGPVDVFLDDGGHTNRQQIITTVAVIPHVRDGGVLMIEDTHASYMDIFGNPSRYSFMNFAKHVIDSVNTRFPNLPKVATIFQDSVFSVAFYESIVVFHVNRTKCFTPYFTENRGVSFNSSDFRYENNRVDLWVKKIGQRTYLNKIPIVKQLKDFVLWLLINKKMSRYFR